MARSSPMVPETKMKGVSGTRPRAMESAGRPSKPGMAWAEMLRSHCASGLEVADDVEVVGDHDPARVVIEHLGRAGHDAVVGARAGEVAAGDVDPLALRESALRLHGGDAVQEGVEDLPRREQGREA